MAAYRRVIDQLAGHFLGYELEHIDRRKNEEADELSRIGSRREQPPPGTFLDQLHSPMVRPPKEVDSATPPSHESPLVAVTHSRPDWTEPYMAYLLCGELPDDEVESRQIVRCCKFFTINNNELYKHSTAGVYLRCISPDEGRQILIEIHSGDCGHHVGSCSLLAKAFRHGFFCLTAHADAIDIVCICVGCQKYAHQPHLPETALKTIPITRPFVVWGIDMVGPFKRAKGSYTHLLVAVDKFTKWVEAKPISKLDGHTMTKFLKEIIFRYRYSHIIITNNGSNFSIGDMAAFCREKGIRLDVSSVAHAQSNGQVE
jgi:hypothetical protein